MQQIDLIPIYTTFELQQADRINQSLSDFDLRQFNMVYLDNDFCAIKEYISPQNAEH